MSLKELKMLARKQKDFLNTTRGNLDTSAIGAFPQNKTNPGIVDKLRDLKNIMHGLKTSRIS